MSDFLHITLKGIVILLLSCISMAVHRGNVVHNKVNVKIICVLMNSIDNLVFWGIVLDDLLCKDICQFRCNSFKFVKR